MSESIKSKVIHTMVDRPYQSGDLRRSKAKSDAEGYPAFETFIKVRVEETDGPLFQTKTTGLFDHFLANLPESRRKHYNCDHCRAFVDRYGGLVQILEDGNLRSILWHRPDRFGKFFREAVRYLNEKVTHARIDGVFYSSDEVWGSPSTKATKESAQHKKVAEWTHLSGKNPEPFSDPLKTADQMAAEKLQDYILLKDGLGEYSEAVLAETVRLFESGALERSEKVLERSKWMLALQRKRNELGLDGSLWDRILWRATATAPPGWCHVSSSAFRTVMDDLKQGLPFDDLKRRWDAKMHPLQYQRPTAPPTDGQIAAAEKVVSKLASEFAFERRYAKLEEILLLTSQSAHARYWTPRVVEGPEKVSKGGMFDHLKKVADVRPGQVALPPRVMTWEKFRNEVLPAAVEMDLILPAGPDRFFGFVTAVHPDAPPILQWDGLEGHLRNPVSWYFRSTGSYSYEWSLGTVGGFLDRTIVERRAKVNVIVVDPPRWQEPEKFKHQPVRAFLILEGAREANDRDGAMIFPETLKSEYHAVRHVIEAHSASLKLAGREEATACGLAFYKDAPIEQVLVVRDSAGVETRYRIDRWE